MSIFRNSLYSLVGNVSKVLLSIGGVVVLGRILGPTIFGEFAVVMAVHVMLQPFINIGLGPAYYKVDSKDDRAADAFFSLQAFLGFAIAGFLAIIAYPLALFYENEGLLGLFLLLALSQAFMGLGLQPYAEATKRNEYGSVAVVQIVALVSGLSTGVILAISGFGIWSLAFKFLVTSMVSLLGYFIVVKRRYSFVPWSEVKRYRASFIFSIKLGLGRLVSGFSNGLDKMMLGAYVDDTVLGNYDRSFQFSQYPDSAIRTSLTNPILTYIASDQKPEKKYLKIFKAMHFLAGLVCVGFFVYGDTLISVLLGRDWSLAAQLFPILGVLALGKVLRGIYLVVEINEGNGNKILSKSITSTFFVYVIGFSALHWYEDVYTFSVAFALSWLIYWLISLFMFFKRKTGGEIAREMAVFFFTSVGLLMAIGLIVRRIVYDLIENMVIELGISIIFTTGFFLFFFYFLFPKDASNLKKLISRKR